jgi:hypothetical protein
MVEERGTMGFALGMAMAAGHRPGGENQPLPPLGYVVRRGKYSLPPAFGIGKNGHRTKRHYIRHRACTEVRAAWPVKHWSVRTLFGTVLNS